MSVFNTGASSWMTDASPLKLLISRATYPSQPEPNYALNIEVAEYVNQKKANTPREAAMMTVGLVNHRNPHIAMLALSLLDTLVQACGYPFHLQIATKEFLNELVRRFPERPPPFPGPVMSRILELIHGWKEGICVDSRWKEDLGNIRDMHRLLTFKGYRFRDFPRQQQNTVAAAANLKTAEELENEDREAQSAKLQELIRRGTPRDLAQAQELMKSLAGANPDAKPDYKSQALTELNKLESKVILLNEMLDNVDVSRGERFATGDVYDQVASILKNARPKIQGWISNAETDDSESLGNASVLPPDVLSSCLPSDTFLQINDQINTVLNRYESFKKGDYVAASNPIPAELASGAASSSRPQNDLSLIDFDDSAPTTNLTAGGSSANDLESLFGSSAPAVPQQTQPAQPSFPFQTQQSFIPQTTLQSAPLVPNPSTGMRIMTNTPPPNLNFSTHPGMGNTPVAPSPQMNGAIRLPGTPQVQPQQGIRMGSPAPNYFGTPQSTTPAATNPTMGYSMNGGSMSGMGMGGNMGMSMPPQHLLAEHTHFHQALQPTQRPASQPQQQAQPTSSTNANQAQGKDPFADLVGLF
ncbi:hypothetical protein NLI96_g5437 [Meripilus lineatus]|uniref:VHS domain-containing protein n=1 Tax=Meripilus lineatus TaxID=2056292 RepID=A0AAD5YJ16_9APHY|nr:hypothetical protein NLI96_g5437 [Physisporinus lineatus]